jgi:hypothetical protein
MTKKAGSSTSCEFIILVQSDDAAFTAAYLLPCLKKKSKASMMTLVTVDWLSEA